MSIPDLIVGSDPQRDDPQRDPQRDNTLRICPPLIIKKPEAYLALDIIEEAIRKLGG